MGNINRIFDLLDLYRGPYTSNKVVFAGKEGNVWRTYSAGDYVSLTDRVSAALLSIGVGKGTKVATVMKNCPEWNFLDMGLLQIGAVQVPVYPTICNENFEYILNHADIDYVFVFDEIIYGCIKKILPRCPRIKEVFSVKKIDGLRNWDEFLSLGSKSDYQNQIQSIREQILPDELATIIYTSGTTGEGKGVMLSHRNFVSNFMAAQSILAPKKVKTALSFLPLCHVYERLLNYVYQYLGIRVFYADRLENLAETMREVSPDMICAVPRMLEKVFDRILVEGRNLPRPQKMVFMWAFHLAIRFRLYGAKGWSYEFRRKIADLLVYRKWRKALGGKLRYVVSGGASLRPRIAKVFWAAGIQVVEGYGLTETSPVIAVGTFEPGGMKFGTVGPPLNGVEVKIAEDGEILCRGPNVMLGYYKNPALTSEAIDEEGWFYTGDIGTLDEGKFVKITDRKKEIFKTSGGKYIAPQVIENRMKESEFIENIIVIGENRHYPVALIVPSFEFLKSWCIVKGYPHEPNEEMIKLPAVIEKFTSEIDKQNYFLGRTEQIWKFRLLDHEWSPESGELTPTLKLRRRFIHSKYARLINRLYSH